MADKTKPKTVALVGMARTHRHLAPFGDTDVEIWTINESHADREDFKDKEGNHFISRCTRHFQLHPYWNAMRPTNNNDPNHPEWLKQEHDFPIYMQEAFPDCPSAVKYPYDEVFGKFPKWAEYTTSTLPYLIALALYEGFERIEVWGFDMASRTEYEYQKAASEFWLGIATGMGIDLVFPDNCKLLAIDGHPEMYAYEMVVDVNVMRMEMERDRMGRLESEAVNKLNLMRGDQQYLMRMLNSGELNDEQIGKVSQELAKLESEMVKTHTQASFYAGGRQSFQKIWADLSGQLAPDLVIPHYKIISDEIDVERTVDNVKRSRGEDKAKLDAPKPKRKRRKRG